MTRHCKSYWPWILLLLGLPLAALGLLLLPNEHESWGGAGIDCDGPFLLVFSVPAIALYLACAMAFARRAILSKALLPTMAAIFCMLLVAVLSANSLAAFKELQRADHRASCA